MEVANEGDGVRILDRPTGFSCRRTRGTPRACDDPRKPHVSSDLVQSHHDRAPHETGEASRCERDAHRPGPLGTAPDRGEARKLDEWARKEMRSLSSYVAKLIVQKLDRVSTGF